MFLDGSERMPLRSRELIEDPSNTIFVSDISLWEVAIKHGKRPDILPRTCAVFAELCDTVGFVPLPLTRNAILAYEQLDISRAEGIRKDPFDRMLITQAKAEGVLLLTHDRSLLLYGEPHASVA